MVASNDTCFVMFHNVLTVFNYVLPLVHDVSPVVHDVSHYNHNVLHVFHTFADSWWYLVALGPGRELSYELQ